VALSHIGGNATPAIPILVEMIRGEPPYVRRTAVWALGGVDPEAAIDDLRSAARQALKEIKEKDSRRDPAVEPPHAN
jgi:HEAT repeat protein